MQARSERAALRTILFADLAQYSRLTAADELGTLDLVSLCFQLFQTHCEEFGAEFIKTTGDGVLILFDGVSSAIDYAIFMQGTLADLLDKRPFYSRFRIGLHIGEVHRRDGDVFGHAINVAARVQTMAEPGGVCVTQDVYWAARNTARWRFRFAGRPALKNMPEPLALYYVVASNVADVPDNGHQRLISVIDGLGLYREDGEAIALRSPKAQALIGYLALSSNYQEVHDRLATLIWPERSQVAARRAMANCLQIAEKSIAGDSAAGILRRGNIIGLSPSRISVDVVRMLKDLGEGKIDDLLLKRSDWSEAILFGLEGTSDLFSAWLSVTRHNWRDHALEALEAMLERFEMSEPAMRRAANALLVLEPSHERAARCLIRHHAELHNVAAAMRVYETLRAFLRERYQLAPSVETTALAEALKAPEPLLSQNKKARRPGGPAPTLAVGKFEARPKRISPLVWGFRSELVANLSKFREFTVIELKDGAIEGPDTDYLLTAQCVDSQDDMQLVVSVSDPGTNHVIWSEAFRFSLGNWLSLQKQVVGKIASTLEVYLSHDRLSRQVRGLPQDLGVYDAWLRGEDLLTRWTPDADDEAERLFEGAIVADQNFAPAYASLASIHNARQFIRPGIAADPSITKRAAELAQRAVALDPLDARNHLVVAWSTAMTRHFEQSEVHYELAAELNPNSPKTLVSAALGMAFMGRVGPATQFLERAMDLTSMFLDYQWSHISVIRYFAGDFEGAIAAADRSRNAIVDTAGWKTAALCRLGRTDEARAALMQLQESVAAAWAGPAPPTLKDILDWFLGAFPIKRDEDRRDLVQLIEV
ncbi:MAG: hypothetical protein EOS54_26920 [Mesorhizobium sp.]|uniref:adenylate/guanylate cyclase domain-containing protein n=1 Tax=unclassified Mesorhizobium TaxID=325217 RepID=UPI000F75A638|nr:MULTISPECIES: adenylate/guanylate cyclase domain-containing protein [unclassified Mesorhizobium]AZO49905.1 hypothetical protein EJ073_20420 [Mesorhizobium sp. M4B.F.Ca.ET.058.02.1.1]RVC47086.1 hypothetical protein EN781_02660 [Mesorhizobium sp. M4A.F.Ca.ET.090.04.2.1]RVD37780.1 hypothetical protein EN742_19330 [Mesorhizobium sp. M4A.F.Ca.ET.020.02.1.1]RWC14967.1 MAG: hypothetical protein EOS53_21955 [Mesorhizobium sp.]RWC40445.1 MAG: hypothetical protein EOS54_26920 [Mesorhizobium sp.]